MVRPSFRRTLSVSSSNETSATLSSAATGTMPIPLRLSSRAEVAAATGVEGSAVVIFCPQGLSVRSERSRPQHGPLCGLWQVNRNEIVFGVQVVLPRLVDHPELLVLCCIIIGELDTASVVPVRRRTGCSSHKRRIVVPCVSYQPIQNTLDLVLLGANLMRFVLMNLGPADCAIRQPDARETLVFPPSAPAMGRRFSVRRQSGAGVRVTSSVIRTNTRDDHFGTFPNRHSNPADSGNQDSPALGLL